MYFWLKTVQQKSEPTTKHDVMEDILHNCAKNLQKCETPMVYCRGKNIGTQCVREDICTNNSVSANISCFHDYGQQLVLRLVLS